MPHRSRYHKANPIIPSFQLPSWTKWILVVLAPLLTVAAAVFLLRQVAFTRWSLVGALAFCLGFLLLSGLAAYLTWFAWSMSSDEFSQYLRNNLSALRIGSFFGRSRRFAAWFNRLGLLFALCFALFALVMGGGALWRTISGH